MSNRKAVNQALNQISPICVCVPFTHQSISVSVSIQFHLLQFRFILLFTNPHIQVYSIRCCFLREGSRLINSTNGLHRKHPHHILSTTTQNKSVVKTLAHSGCAPNHRVLNCSPQLSQLFVSYSTFIFGDLSCLANQFGSQRDSLLQCNCFCYTESYIDQKSSEFLVCALELPMSVCVQQVVVLCDEKHGFSSFSSLQVAILCYSKQCVCVLRTFSGFINTYLLIHGHPHRVLCVYVHCTISDRHRFRIIITVIYSPSYLSYAVC